MRRKSFREGIGYLEAIPTNRHIAWRKYTLPGILFLSLKNQTKGRVASTLEKFNYSLKEDKINLSGGEESIIFFALAQAATPLLLVLDEPTSNLDERNIDIIWSQLQKFHDAGGTVLLISHDKTIGVKATKSFVLEKGHLSLIVENDDFIEKPTQKSILTSINPNQLSFHHWIYLLSKHIHFNLLQTIQNDNNYIIFGFISSIVYAFLPSFISKINNSVDPNDLFKYIADSYTFYLTIAATSSTGSSIAIELQNQTLTKIFKILPLPPIIYLSAKAITSLIFVTFFVLVMMLVTLVMATAVPPTANPIPPTVAATPAPAAVNPTASTVF